MPDQEQHTTREEISQGIGGQDDWRKEIIPRLAANLEEQARKLKAFEPSRKIVSATDLLRGLLAYVYTAHSFQHLSSWSVVLAVADVPANDWGKRLQKASPWLDWLLQEVLASRSSVSPWLIGAGVSRILLLAGTHWKCLGPKGVLWRGQRAFDLLAGRLPQIKVTDCQEGEQLEIFDLQKGALVVTDRAKGLGKRIAFVLCKVADIVVAIRPSKVPMQEEQGGSMSVLDWLKGLHAPAGGIASRTVWMTSLHKRITLRLLAFRLSQEHQEKAERRRKRKASKNQQKVQSKTLYFSGWVLGVRTLPQEQWSDRQLFCLSQARWQIELLFKRSKHFLKRQSVRAKTEARAKSTITLRLLGWALVEEESAAVPLAMKEAIHSTWPTKEGQLVAHTSCGQDDLCGPWSPWMLAEARFDLFCQHLRGG